MIIKRISRAPIYHTRWEHRALMKPINRMKPNSLRGGKGKLEAVSNAPVSCTCGIFVSIC